MADPITAAIEAIGWALGEAGFFSAEAFLVFNAAQISSALLTVAPIVPGEGKVRRPTPRPLS